MGIRPMARGGLSRIIVSALRPTGLVRHLGYDDRYYLKFERSATRGGRIEADKEEM
jgi:hypothetical protein